jgi:uncharacterized protein YpmB
MKNSFKLGLLALAISASFTACYTNAKKPATDSPAAAVDTGNKIVDSLKTNDTTKTPGDTTKIDSVKK